MYQGKRMLYLAQGQGGLTWLCADPCIDQLYNCSRCLRMNLY